jgi:ElaB/YqjD/DUF883 family membrane-anchored ribosome-binding protein
VAAFPVRGFQASTLFRIGGASAIGIGVEDEGTGMDENQMTESAGSALESLTEQIHEGIRRGKYSWGEIQEAVMDKTREAAANTDQYVHENPWKVIGIAAGLGLVLGLLMAPDSDD